MDEYVPTIPIIRFKPHKVKSRNMMDKMLNRHFDKVVEGEFNEQRMRSEQLSEGSFTKCGNRWEKRMSARNIDLYERVLEAKRKRNVVFEKYIQTHQQSGISK